MPPPPTKSSPIQAPQLNKDAPQKIVPSTNVNIDHKVPVTNNSEITEDGNPLQTHFLPPNSQKFNIRPYQEVKQMQLAISDLHKTILEANIPKILSDNQQLTSLLNKKTNSASSKNPVQLQSRINTLAMNPTNQKNINSADGKWGQNTNNALISANAIAGGMIAICNGSNTPLSFNDTDWKNMWALINSKKIKLSVPQKATELTKLISKLKDEVSTFATVIQTDVPNKDTMLSVNKSSKPMYGDIQYLQQNANALVGNLQFNRVPLHYKDLVSKDAFKTFIKEVSGQEPDQQSMIAAIENFKAQLGAK